MNYLAHAYLSFRDPGVTVGNMISDFVKGRKQFDYPAAIRRGIVLHRAIDEFTDSHPATKEAKEVFRPHYRLYSGAFVDVVYDHFLANDSNEFPGHSLQAFSQQVYSVIDQYTEWLPERFAGMYPYMKMQDWLYNYRTIAGISKSLAGVVYRAAYLSDSRTAILLFGQHYQLLQDCYRQFWVDVLDFARNRFSEHG